MLASILFVSGNAFSQEIIRKIGDRTQQITSTSGSGSQSDSLRHRDKFEDSITIYYRYIDSTKNYLLDSSINDFYTRYPVPSTHIHLGNTGNAARSLLFSPEFNAGFDFGFHAFDVYKWKLEKIRFFSTTRPYSELNYLLGSRAEQIIHLFHTQNINPDWNIGFEYRLINSPGFFKNQNTNHNNYLINSWYQSRNRRYQNYFVYVRNKLQSGENGGIADTVNYLDDPIYKDRFNIPVWLGGDNVYSTNFFTTKINTGTLSNEFTLMLRQQYDLGRKDSIVTDSTVIPLFFPRLRFEHTITYNSNKYEYIDYVSDSAYYTKFYDTSFAQAADTFRLKDSWREIVNDFSIYQFPDAKNQHQFIRLGIMYQHLAGQFISGSSSLYNLAGHAEYRNKTRDQRWDIEANGKLYFTGYNAGDYQAYVSLQRFAGKKLGYIQLGFANTSRTPSFKYDQRSSFYLDKTSSGFNKENSTRLFASYYSPSFRMRLYGNYFLLSNYTYLTDYYKLRQESSLFNVLQLALQKTFRLSRHWNWHLDFYFQQVIGNVQVNLPVIYTRSRIAYEGNLGFKNLDIAMGAELKYRPPYNADGYSPVLSHFFYQDSVRISNFLPDISAYLNFRIRPFKAFIRAENLNTARNLDGLTFTNNNLVAPGYPLPGLQIRLGIYWSFVN